MPSVAKQKPPDGQASSWFGGIKILQPLSHRNFRLLWIGSLFSMVGGQLTLIAFPWLVLKISGDPLAIGLILAVASIPRALFMLVGGVATDRFSARAVMIWSTWLRLLIMVILTVLVFGHWIEMWLLYVMALIFGLVDAFFWPASSALVPRLVPEDVLHSANGLIQGTAQISVMIGPVLAGLIISIFSATHDPDVTDLTGIATVFALDSAGFLISLMTLLLLVIAEDKKNHESFTPKAAMVLALAGFKELWRDHPVRWLSISLAIFSLFWRGPYLVGIPVLCDTRFEDGALAFGLIGSSYGVGALIGLVAAASFTKPDVRWYGILLLFNFIVLGLGMFVYASAFELLWVSLATALAGVVDGYVTILLISWLQLRIAKDMLGRVMSVIMFFNAGLTPVSASLAGFFIGISLNGVFIVAGIILVTLSCLGLAHPIFRNFDQREITNE